MPRDAAPTTTSPPIDASTASQLGRLTTAAGRRLWSLVAVVVLLSGFGLTAISVNQMRLVENRAAKAEFESLNERIAQEFESRVTSFVILAQGTAGLLDSRLALTDEVWQAYVQRLDPQHKWLGFRGMAVALALSPEREVEFVAAQRRGGQKEFRIWQHGNRTDDAASSAVLEAKRIPITFMAPKSPANDAIVGFDLATEPVRATAIANARDSGQPVLTAPIELLNNDGNHDRGLVLMAPIYRAGKISDLHERRQGFLGVIVLGLGSTRILKDILETSNLGGVAVRLTDLGSSTTLIDTTGATSSAQALFSHSITQTLGRRDWLFEFQTTAAYTAAIDRQQSELIGAFGVFGSLLLTALAYYQVALRYRAEERAKEMTADLRGSEERFRLIAEAAGEGIWDQDFVNHREYWSPRLVTEILGYPPEAFSDKLLQVTGLIHPEDRERWQEARRSHIQNGAPYYVEIRLKHGAGNWVWIASRGKAVFDERGTLLRMAGSMADISERKGHELALERQQAFLRTVLDSLPEPIMVKQPAGKILIANKAYARQVGLSPDQVAGRTTHELFAEEVADPAVALDSAVAEDGLPRTIEILIPDPTRGGELRYVQVMKMLCEGLDGEPLIIGAHQDVTEIRRSEKRFRELSEMSSDWFWEQDEQFRFTEMSTGLRSSGREPARAVGKYRWDMPIDWTPKEWEDHRRLLEAHQPFSRLQYRIRNDAGDWRWYSISGKPMFDDYGKFIGYRGTGVDITARKEVEEELRQHRDNLAAKVDERTAQLLLAKEAAEAASQAKSEFLANMSHELRTPLHAILSFAQLGQTKATEASPEKVAGYFSKIHGSGSRLLGLVNNLLDLSKLEAGKMQLSVRNVNLAILVQEVADELEALAGKRGLRFDLPPPGAEIMATIDPIRFGQVIHNLLSNAIKFSRPDGTIQIDITEATMAQGRRADDPVVQVPAWRIAVIDEGVGIPEGELDAVFDKFVQSSKTTTGAGGTGLGLSISKEIIEAHRGQIRAYNREDISTNMRDNNEGHPDHDDHDGSGGAVFEILIPRDKVSQGPI